jgi:hypothetical protein
MFSFFIGGIVVHKSGMSSSLFFASLIVIRIVIGIGLVGVEGCSIRWGGVYYV